MSETTPTHDSIKRIDFVLENKLGLARKSLKQNDFSRQLDENEQVFKNIK